MFELLDLADDMIAVGQNEVVVFTLGGEGNRLCDKEDDGGEKAEGPACRSHVRYCRIERPDPTASDATNASA